MLAELLAYIAKGAMQRVPTDDDSQAQNFFKASSLLTIPYET